MRDKVVYILQGFLRKSGFYDFFRVFTTPAL